MPTPEHAAFRLARIQRCKDGIGAALLEIQELGAKHREAVARLNRHYMEMAEAMHGSVAGPHSIEETG